MVFRMQITINTPITTTTIFAEQIHFFDDDGEMNYTFRLSSKEIDLNCLACIHQMGEEQIGYLEDGEGQSFYHPYADDIISAIADTL